MMGAKPSQLPQREHKSLFGSFSSEKEQNLLFLKKKKQKDLNSSRPALR
jgi:hypothetical protein